MSGLATELGVSAGELQAAMEKLREAGGSPDDMAASLAKELGLIDGEGSGGARVAPQRPADGGQPPSADTTSA